MLVMRNDVSYEKDIMLENIAKDAHQNTQAGFLKVKMATYTEKERKNPR